MKRAGLAVVLAASLFGGYSAAAEPVMVCDSLCWFKTRVIAEGRFAQNESELNQLSCKRIIRTNQEGIGWRDAIASGDLDIGKEVTIESSDLPPRPGAANCDESGGSRGVRVSGFAFRVKVCGVAHASFTAGQGLVLQACGAAPNGSTVIYFPLPPL
jgi:hypothetical protein